MTSSSFLDEDDRRRRGRKRALAAAVIGEADVEVERAADRRIEGSDMSDGRRSEADVSRATATAIIDAPAILLVVVVVVVVVVARRPASSPRRPRMI